MFGRKKEGKKPAGGRPRAANQFGLLDMGGMTDFDPNSGGGLYGGIEDDDAGLEAEFQAITTGKALPPRTKRKPPPADLDSLNEMIAESLKDIPSDDDDFGSDLEDDPELLAELQQLTPEISPEDSPMKIPTPVRRPAPPPPEPEPETPSKNISTLLEERITMYQTALSNAKASGESGFKLRRLERGLKTLDGQLKNAKAGKSVSEDEIPPEVATGAAKPKPQLQPEVEPEPVPKEIPPVNLIQAEIQPNVPGLSPPKSPALSTSPHDSPKRASPVEDFPIPSAPMETPEKKTKVLPEPTSSGSTDKTSNTVYEMLCKCKKQYKQAALMAKRSGDTAQAMEMMRTAMRFDKVIEAAQKGQPVDLSGMPPPPPGFEAVEGPSQAVVSPKKPVPTPRTVTTQPQGSASLAKPEGPTPGDEVSSDEPVDPSVFNAPPPPSSTLEALEQRRDKYLSTMKESQEQNNSGRARRMGRLVKQYEDAIKLYNAGKPVPYDDLPDPPGFAPIPRPGGPPAAVTPTPAPAPSLPPKPKPVIETGPSVAEAATPGPSASTAPAIRPPAGGSTAKPGQAVPAVPQPKKKRCLQEKQLLLMQERERLFREAALEAKKRGDIELAKDYLRNSKKFAPLIENLKMGLPVDIKSTPIPPQQESARKKEAETDTDGGFEVIDYSDCLPLGDREEMFTKLEADLKSQIKMCTRNHGHFSRVGDVTNARKFQLLAEHADKDLTWLKYALKNGDPVPRFHYELRTFTIVQCFTDLNDNELELTIVRGLNYSCSNPKEIDTYVKFEFPYPAENSPKDRTSTVKDTNNPEYNKSFILAINRKARAFLRVVKSKAVKLEVVSKGGLFRSDTVLGTVSVKLAPLENKNFIHDSFDIMDGRKATGGKLEIKIRIREPVSARQIEEIKEKWLVIDQYKIK